MRQDLFQLVFPMGQGSHQMRLYYATHDGQSRMIAERIALRVTESGSPIEVVDLDRHVPGHDELAAAEGIVLVAAVRYGHHLPQADRLLAACRDLPESVKLAVVSVNLSARKPGRDTAEGNPYLGKWLKRRKITPTLATAIAGRLDYPRYGWFDREMIRLIMRITGGPTDPGTQITYTDWDKVDAFAARIAAWSVR